MMDYSIVDSIGYIIFILYYYKAIDCECCISLEVMQVMQFRSVGMNLTHRR